jgi:hypothetical protein
MNTQLNQASQDIIDKVRKILALSASPNENEAEVAINMAADLLQKYNLELSDLESEAEENQILEDYIETNCVLSDWKQLILSGICLLNGVKPLSLGNKDNNLKDVVLVGKPVSIATTRRMYLYLIKAVDRLVKEQKGKGKGFIKLFRLGLANRLKDRLIAKRKEMNAEASEGALVVQSAYDKDMQEINNYLSHLNPAKPKIPKFDENHIGFIKGEFTANRISLNDQLAQH